MSEQQEPYIVEGAPPPPVGMIDRIAREIPAKLKVEPDLIEQALAGGWYHRFARELLTLMREPTDEMKRARHQRTLAVLRGDAPSGGEWEWMIDAALAELSNPGSEVRQNPPENDA